MTRLVVGALLVAAVAVGLLLAGLEVVREQRYQQFIGNGDRALASDQAFAAIEAYSGAIALRDDSMIAFLKRAEAYRRRGELGAAARDLRTATRLDPQAVRPAEILGDVNYGLARFARAVEAYRDAAGIDDRSPRILYKLALALYRSGDGGAAIEPLRKAVTLDPRLAEAHHLLGRCLKDQGQTRDALRAFEDAIKASPGLAAPREEAAALYQAQGRAREAIEQLEAVAALETDRPERQAAVALAHARSGRADAAIDVLRRAAYRYPDNAVIYLTLGRVWLESAESRRDRVGLRRALEALEPLTRGPNVSGEALALYGRTLVLSGDLVRGEAALRQASDMLPVALDTLLWLADAAERLGHAPVVRDALERWAAVAPESHPNLPVVYERIGDLAARAGDQRGAIRAWRLAAGPQTSVALLVRLAGAEAAAGETVAARATVARGLAKDPRHPALLALQHQLE
jgi:tetratricopeptide (TPR) repeat protein